ncbi:MAG: hypothetical protein M1820_001194 [Bogoriella megaspora]|nr:MAG: hypothetical protein M1820_001194 [Bogoriella megaspora]
MSIIVRSMDEGTEWSPNSQVRNRIASLGEDVLNSEPYRPITDMSFSRSCESFALSAPIQRPSTSALTVPGLILDLEALKLIHHFTVETYVTLSRSQPDHMYIWQTEIPTKAYSNPFLMHSILAISALHLVSKGELSEEIALKYYHAALQSFQHSSKTGLLQDAAATLVFCVIIFIITLGLGSRSARNPGIDPVECFFEPFTLLRRSIPYLKSIHVGECKEPIGKLISPIEPEPLPLPEDVAEALRILEEHNDNLVESELDRETYKLAIEELRELFMMMPDMNPPDWTRPARWLILMSDAFDNLLHQRQPLALVMLAYWCIPVHNTLHSWFMGDWARRIVFGVALRLDSAWDETMRWPLRMVNTSLDRH